MSSESSSQGPPPFPSIALLSELFKNAHHFSIGDNGNLSTVHGNQHNHYNVQGRKKVTQFIVGSEEEEAEYEQFREVLRSDVIALRDVHRDSVERFDRKRQKWVEWGAQTVVAGEVLLEGTTRKCLAVSYSGKGAVERWKKDFRKFGGARHSGNAQLVAINRSRIPMHVILGDLVPAAHLADQVDTVIGRSYLGALTRQTGCASDDSLWLDTSRGIFCRGPKGPAPALWDWDAENQPLPLDAELLQDDIMIRYCISRKLDRGAVDVLARIPFHDFGSQVDREIYRPTVISTRKNTILAAGGAIWRVMAYQPVERRVLPNETTSFKFYFSRFLPWARDKEFSVTLWDHQFEPQYAWNAQAMSVFDAHGIPLEGDLSDYKLVIPELYGTLSTSRAKRRRRERLRTLYLFIVPSSTTTFWSFDSDGQIPISNDLCRYLGLPPQLLLKHHEFSWKTSTYQRIRDYQIARGFDPTTIDFARHNKYSEYDIVDQPFQSHFEEINGSELEPIDSPLDAAAETSSAENAPQEENVLLGNLFGDVHPEHLEQDSFTSEVATIQSQFEDDFPMGPYFKLNCSGAQTVKVDSDSSVEATAFEQITYGHSQPGTTEHQINVKGTSNTTIWSGLMSKFSWAAVKDSDIPAAGF